MNIGVTVRVTRNIVAAVSAVTISASAVDQSISAQAAVATDINYSTFIVPIYPVAEDQVGVGDGEGIELALTKDLDVFKTEEALPEDSDPIFDVDKVLTDSVNAVESRVFVFTDFIDIDPADDDVDPDPVTITEADAKDITVGELADNDDVTMSEASAKEATKPGITATVSMSEGIDDFDIGKNPSDTATISEAIDQFDVTTEFDDTVTATEELAKNFEFTETSNDSVTVVQSNLKTFNSSVDFDPSDDDVDPDPITPSDAINEFDFTKGLTDTASATESSAKSVTVGDIADNDDATVTEAISNNPEIPKTDSVTAVEGIKNNPELAKSDTASATDAITKFDARPAFSDSITAPTDAIDDFDIQLAKSDTVNVSDVNVKNFTENVDFDRSDADADADPVTVTEVLGFNATHPVSDSFSPSDAAPVFAFTNVYTDTATATESINTTLTLGESEYVYPDIVYMSDGSEGFVQDRFRFTKLDYTAQVNSGDMLLNSAVMWGGATDDLARASFTGVIGYDGFIGQVVMNSDTITYPDTSNAGLVVNFLYTDVDEDDRALGGYYFNQTPINAGNSVVGARTIL
jgi:hypothetical protein